MTFGVSIELLSQTHISFIYFLLILEFYTYIQCGLTQSTQYPSL